jgi:hypothetical protein
MNVSIKLVCNNETRAHQGASNQKSVQCVSHDRGGKQFSEAVSASLNLSRNDNGLTSGSLNVTLADGGFTDALHLDDTVVVTIKIETQKQQPISPEEQGGVE